MDVFLKVVDRPFSIFQALDGWVKLFRQDSSYNIVFLNDSSHDLVARYGIGTQIKLRSTEQAFIAQQIQNASPIKHHFHWAGVANLAPFKLSQTEFFWNIDADDIFPNNDFELEHLKKVEQIAKNEDLLSFSYDLSGTIHFLFPDIDHHWTFGIHLGKKIKEVDKFVAGIGVDVPPFGINLDHIFSRISEGKLFDGKYKGKIKQFIFDDRLVIQRLTGGEFMVHGLELKEYKTVNINNSKVASKKLLHFDTTVLGLI